MRFQTICAALLTLYVGVAQAADIARLEWGTFVLEDDSSNGFLDYKTTLSDDGKSITLTFSSLEAKADGSTLAAKADVIGRYDVFQPEGDAITSCRIDITGHIIKGKDSEVRIVVKAAGQDGAVVWTAGDVESGVFNRSVDIAMPAGGRLPSPFVLSLEIAADKKTSADAAYVSVETLTVTAQHPQIAAR